MKKVLITITILCTIFLAGCSNESFLPNDLEELYDVFLSDEFNNVTISNTDYNSLGVASTGTTIKVDGENYHMIFSREDECYYSITEDKSTKYTSEDGEWKLSTPTNVVIDSLAMKRLFYDIIPSSIDLEDFSKEDNKWIYEITTDNIFNIKIKTYTVNFLTDYIEVCITEQTTTTGDNVTVTNLNIKDTKISNFGTTKVLLPELE